MLDRSIAPVAKPFIFAPLSPWNQTQLLNGTDVHLLQHGDVEVAQVQLLFRAGTSFEPKIGVAQLLDSMLSEGTVHKTSLEFSQQLDQWGAWTGCEHGDGFVSISVFCLSRVLAQCLPLLAEMAFEASLPNDAFERMRKRMRQSLRVSQQKTGYIASKRFGQLLFGEAHPYGSSMDEAELDAIAIEDIRGYYRDHIYAGNMQILVSGNFSETALMQTLNQVFGYRSRVAPVLADPKSKTFPIQTNIGAFSYPVAGVQSTIRVGHLAIDRGHNDADSMELVNLLFGGFFGSRLMKNIREEKGYTYGIFSAYQSFNYSGQFCVVADVGNEYVEPTLIEIRHEMVRLINDGLSQSELDLVRNYKYGKSIGQRETAFQMLNLVRFSIVNEVSFSQLDEKQRKFADITCEQMQTLAAQYFHPNHLLQVVAGKTL